MPIADAHQEELKRIRSELLTRLNGFSSETSDDAPRDLKCVALPREDFPVPDLILLLLRNLLGWEWSGQGEKIRWEVYGSVEGEPLSISLEKFGLRMRRPDNSKVANKRVVGQLKSAISYVEKEIKPAIVGLVSLGKVSMANHTREFMSRYEFFRDKAGKAFRRAKRHANQRLKGGYDFNDGIAPLLFGPGYAKRMEAEQEGYYYTVAMVDAYFSALEHRLNLLRAFTGSPLPENGFNAFMGKKWNPKLDEILGKRGVSKSQNTLQRMRVIKERIRNPFAHGGYENDQGALHVHFPSIGAIPGNLTKFGKSVRFSFIPVGVSDHEEVCSVFDEVDMLLKAEHLAGPHIMLDAGMDASFDERSLEKYRHAISKGESYVEEFASHWNEMRDRHVNMDY